MTIIRDMTQRFRSDLERENESIIREATLSALSQENREELAKWLSIALPEYFKYNDIVNGKFIAYNLNSTYDLTCLDDTVIPRKLVLQPAYVVEDLAFGIFPSYPYSKILILTSNPYRISSSMSQHPYCKVGEGECNYGPEEMSRENKLSFTSELEEATMRAANIREKYLCIGTLDIDHPNFYSCKAEEVS